jgi:RNA polymerase sigma-70 factor (ECF subfamily)
LNTAISNFRREKKKVKYEPIFGLTREAISEHIHNDQIDQMNALYQAIEKLHKIDKAIILLYLEEKSYKEISEIMGITVANAGMRIKRIKEKLAEIFTKIK